MISNQKNGLESDRTEITKPLFSFIVPVYNTSTDLLRRCVDSILDSDVSKELILVDDGSTDETLKVFYEEYAENPTVRIIIKPNGGVSSARNTGLLEAGGEYIVFADADDYIIGTTFVEAVSIVLKNPQTDVFCFSYNVTDEHGKIRTFGKSDDTSFNVKSISEFRSLNDGIHFNMGVVWAKIYRRTSIEGLKFEEEIRFAEDNIYNFSVDERVECFLCICKPWYCYRVNSASVGHRYNPNVAEEFAKSSQRLIEIYKKNFPEDLSALYRDIIFCFYTEYILQIAVYHKKNPASKNEKNKIALRILHSFPYSEAFEKIAGQNLSKVQSLIYGRLKAGKPNQAFRLMRLKHWIATHLLKK